MVTPAVRTPAVSGAGKVEQAAQHIARAAQPTPNPGRVEKRSRIPDASVMGSVRTPPTTQARGIGDK
jgi:hypothetical protein